MIRRHALPLLFLVTAALLAGCATRPPASPAGWSPEDAASMTRFTLRGKVGFRRGEEGGSASLVWKQADDEYELLASGPLGQGATRIRGNDLRIRIESADGQRESDAPALLLAEALGWPVSVNSLSWWARGLAAPGADAEIEPDAEGRPARIRQQGWEIALDRWRADGGRLLPHRIIATGGDSRVTLLVERWEPGSRRGP